MKLHILGIRHHGVGSAKYIAEALVALKPDIILVEGPPELDAVTSWVTHKEMKPPVSVLAYNVDEPSQAVFYPFTHFSPEWQAITYALKNDIKVQMMDLPLSHSFGIELAKKAELKKLLEEQMAKEAENAENEPKEETENNTENTTATPEEIIPEYVPKDPIGHLAELAGYNDSELWWEHHFEQNHIKGSWQDHFEAVFEAMKALRENLENHASERDDAREAYMRKLIREAKKQGFKTAVVVCGAWHAPVLENFEDKQITKQDDEMLKPLPKTNVSCTWIPWTNTRLSMFTGYGAGIVSPGWYDHLWKHPKDKGTRWLSKVAKLFRDKDMDTSTAHVIEAFRLAEALASMRDLSRPGLMELNEATQSVICFGDKILLKLVEEELIVAKAMGKVPNDLPKLPIQTDFENRAKDNRLEVKDLDKSYELDLRKDLDLSKSVFLHQLQILGINWAKKQYTSGKGTFKESWFTRWKPEMVIDLIEKGFWGNTIEKAATQYLLDSIKENQSIAELANIVKEKAFPAKVYEAIDAIIVKITELSSISADVLELMGAVPHLADMGRYGDVRIREGDRTVINALVDTFIRRICIGLPNAAYGLDEKNSYSLFESIKRVDEAVQLLQIEELAEIWYKALKVILHKDGINGIIVGCVCRLLLDAKEISTEQTANEFSQALSTGNAPMTSAAWLEGFLKGSGMILIYDHTLWNILYLWVAQLEQATFIELMPILRRTFSKFEAPERKQIGEKAKHGAVQAQDVLVATGEALHTSPLFDEERALKVLEPLKAILGIG